MLEIEKRREAIVELLKKEHVSDQGQLVALLKKQYKIETNQAVVSRDLRKLGVTKKEIGGKLVYELPTTDIQAEILKLAIVDISHNEAQIVIATQPALAAFVGDAIDAMEDIDILGCLAGENMVFVAPKSIKTIKETSYALSLRLGFKKKK